MTSVVAALLLLTSGIKHSDACIATTTTPTTTTTTPLCCSALSTSNPPRVHAPTGTPGAALDECAVLRRIQRGECPATAEIVCSAARGMSVDEVILQFLSGTTVVASATGTTRATAPITCTRNGYRVTNSAGTLVAFDSVSCNQRTLEGPDFADYYASGSRNRPSYYG